jgi:hypothetical protein
MTQILILALWLQATPALPHAQHGMGFDQQRTTHHFILERAGGTIEVTANDRDDRKSADQVRAHFRHIAVAFGKGDFSLPMFIHEKEPPGVAEMKARREHITYRFEEVPYGAKVVIRTTDARSRNALHEFLRFQIREHRTGDPLEPR